MTVMERSSGTLVRSEITDPPLYWRLSSSSRGADLSAVDVITLFGRATPRLFSSLLQGVGTLPPGFRLAPTADGVAPVRIWCAAVGPSWTDLRPQDAIEAVRSTLAGSVRRAIGNKRRVGVLLSGGFDSTLIAHLARSSCEVRCFVVDHTGRAGPKERIYAELVCARYGLPLTVVAVGPDNLIRLLDRSVEHPTPLLLWAGANQFALSEAAAAQGCELVISGLGSDEVFVGFHKKGHAAWTFADRAEVEGAERVWSRLLNESRRAPTSLFYLGQCCPLNVSWLRRLFPGQAIDAALYDDLMPYYREAAARGDLATNAAILQIEAELRSADLLVNEMTFASALASLPVAYPFFAREVVQLAAQMPISWLYRRGDAPGLRLRPSTKAIEKFVLRLAFQDDIPQEVQVRPRMTFTVPFGHWKEDPRLHSEIVDGTVNSSLWKVLGCRSEVVRTLLEAPAGSDPWASPQRIWTLFSVARWWENGGPERLARATDAGAAAGHPPPSSPARAHKTEDGGLPSTA